MVWPRLLFSPEKPREWPCPCGECRQLQGSVEQYFSAQLCPGVICEPRNQGPGPRPGFQPTQSV